MQAPASELTLPADCLPSESESLKPNLAAMGIKEASRGERLAQSACLLGLMANHRGTWPGLLALAEVKPKLSVFGSKGEVTERLIVPVSKTGVPETVPRVQIPPSPPSLKAVIASR